MNSKASSWFKPNLLAKTFSIAFVVYLFFGLVLLHRKIIFEILNINEKDYKERLGNNISRLDNWNDILIKFLEKIHK